jgi:molybdopterin converting factor small subunit
MSVELVLPGALAELVPGGGRHLTLDVTEPGTVGALLDELAGRLPALERRLRDEQGQLRRHVNIYVDGDDIRADLGLAHPLRPGAEVLVLPSVAGG